MPDCPRCGFHWERSTCARCSQSIAESEAIHTREGKVCGPCAAGMVRAKREAERPRMPDPELDPQGWEAAWRARRRSLGA